MSEETKAYETWTNLSDAWTGVGEAAREASELYVKELSAYLDWANGLQREILAQSLLTTQEISRFSARQMAFLARMRESLPLWGKLPSGMETVQGMVQAVVKEAEGSD